MARRDKPNAAKKNRAPKRVERFTCPTETAAEASFSMVVVLSNFSLWYQ
jgi:hypothetical protein